MCVDNVLETDSETVKGAALVWRKGVELACRSKNGVGVEEGPRMDVRLTRLDAGDEGAGTAVSWQ